MFFTLLRDPPSPALPHAGLFSSRGRKLFLARKKNALRDSHLRSLLRPVPQPPRAHHVATSEIIGWDKENNSYFCTRISMHTFMKKTLKIILIVLASLLILLAIVLIAVSPIAKSYINKHGEELLSRKVQVDGLRVNALNGKANITNLTIYEDDDSTAFVRIDTIDVQLGIMKLLKHEIDLKHATVANLDIRILQDGNRFNFSSIMDFFKAKQDTTQPPDTTAKPWAMGFYNIRLSHWKVDYTDIARGSEWNLKDLNLRVPGVYFSGERTTDAGLELALADGGTLRTKLNFNIESNDFQASLLLSRLSVSNAKAYITDMMNVGDMAGKLSGNIEAAGNLSEVMKTKIHGKLQLNNVDFKDTQHRDVLALNRLALSIRNIDLDKMRFEIDSVVIDGVSTRFDRYAATNNFSQLFDVKKKAAAPAAAKPTAAKSATPAPKPTLHIASVVLCNGKVTFNDHTLESPVHLPLTAIHLTATNVTMNGADKANLSATLPHGGSLSLLWRGKMNDMKANSVANISVRGLQLTDVSPYSEHYIAYPFAAGTFSFASNNTIRHSKIDGKNLIDIYNPEVGERRKNIDSAKHIPLKAALYVLKDKHGNVKLDVPVSGDLSNPKFSYWKAVWKTLGNLLVKVATSPISKIGDALGMNSDELLFLNVDPMQTELSSEQMDKMSQLAKIIQYDSSIVIIMAQQINADAEENILTLGNRRNEQVRAYMRQIGVPDNRLMVLTQEGLSGVKETGYKIDSELKSPDDEAPATSNP